jgi:hypothetical protein
MKTWVKVTDASQVNVGDQVRYGKNDFVDFGDSSSRWVSKIKDGKVITSEDPTYDTRATTDLFKQFDHVEVIRFQEDVVKPTLPPTLGATHRIPVGTLVELDVGEASPYYGMRLYVTGHYFSTDKSFAYYFLGEKNCNRNVLAGFSDFNVKVVK